MKEKFGCFISSLIVLLSAATSITFIWIIIELIKYTIWERGFDWNSVIFFIIFFVLMSFSFIFGFLKTK